MHLRVSHGFSNKAVPSRKYDAAEIASSNFKLINVSLPQLHHLWNRGITVHGKNTRVFCAFIVEVYSKILSVSYTVGIYMVIFEHLVEL